MNMSRLRIQHRTVYSYVRPVRFGRHKLILRPREGHDIRVVQLHIDIQPEHRLIWTRDMFGNSVGIVDFLSDASELNVLSEVVVDRWAPFPRAGADQPWSVTYPVTCDAFEAGIAQGYQSPTYPDDGARVRQWVDERLPSSNRLDAEMMLHHLCSSVRNEIQYLRRSEKGVQTPSVTLDLGRGSCRDMATLMLEAVRSLGIPARFVSGYLHCLASDAGRASTHAWMEAYLPGFGWCGYDPTLGERSSEKHVAVGVSPHPRGVMPISGQYEGTAGDFISLNVQVLTEPLAEGAVR